MPAIELKLVVVPQDPAQNLASLFGLRRQICRSCR